MADEKSALLGSPRDIPVKTITDISTDDSKAKAPVDEVPLLKSFRKYIVMILLAAMTVTSSTQSSMSSALVCIVPAEDNSTNSSNDTSEWKYNWDKQSQGWVLSCFFIGYFVTQFPAGLAVTKWGPKRVLIIGLFFISIFQVLAVPAAYYGLPYLYADRVIAGLIDGFLYSPCYALLGRWAPKPEASLLFAVVGSGLEIGNMVAFVTSTFACQIPIQGGWPFIFYILGSIGLSATLFVTIFVSDSPFDNRFISKEEVRFMSGTVPKVDTKGGGLSEVPVKSILKSKAVWAIIASQFGTYWFYYMYINVSPQYLKEILKFSDVNTNFLSGVPFVFSMLVIFPSGYLSDRMVNKGILSNTTVRKINDFISKMFPAGALLYLAFLPERAFTATFILNTVIAVTSAICFVSWMSNPIDIAPAYTGFIVGLCEGATLWIAVLIPILVETITAAKERSQWQLAFYVAAGVQVVTFIIYAIFASGELEPWALSSYEYDIGIDEEDIYDDDSDVKGLTGSDSRRSSTSKSIRSRPHSRMSRVSAASLLNEDRTRWSFLDGARARSATAWPYETILTDHVRPRCVTEHDFIRPKSRAKSHADYKNEWL